MRGQAAAPRPVLYVRIPERVQDELRELAAAHETTLSAMSARVLERGLAYDEQAVMSLLAWCWQMVGYLKNVDAELSESFAAAIRRCEVALRIRGGKCEAG